MQALLFLLSLKTSGVAIGQMDDDHAPLDGVVL